MTSSRPSPSFPLRGVKGHATICTLGGREPGNRGCCTLASCKKLFPVCTGALMADIAIGYCMHKNSHFSNTVPCSPVTKIAVSQQIYGLSAPHLLRRFIRRIFIINSLLPKKVLCLMLDFMCTVTFALSIANSKKIFADLCLISAWTVTYSVCDVILCIVYMHENKGLYKYMKVTLQYVHTGTQKSKSSSRLKDGS